MLGQDRRECRLEVTETFLMRNIEQTIATLQALKKLGVRISLDDFGTGYSTFGYLQRFPVDSLKINRSFITDITTNPENAAIAKAIIAMAHSLNIKVIAEGVETQGQFDYLAEHQCDAIQGYVVSIPLPAKDFEQWNQQKSAAATELRADI